MKKYKKTVYALAFVLFSCNGRYAKNETEVKCVKTDFSKDTIEVTGLLTIGHEVKSFKADNDTLEYWFIDNTGKIKEMYEKIIPENSENYTPVRATLKIVIEEKQNDGFAADYDGIAKIIEVINIGK